MGCKSSRPLVAESGQRRVSNASNAEDALAESSPIVPVPIEQVENGPDDQGGSLKMVTRMGQSNAHEEKEAPDEESASEPNSPISPKSSQSSPEMPSRERRRSTPIQRRLNLAVMDGRRRSWDGRISGQTEGRRPSVHSQHSDAHRRRSVGSAGSDIAPRRKSVNSSTSDGRRKSLGSDPDHWLRLLANGNVMASHCSSANSSWKRFAEPAQTLIFLDWDDTLFPTSYLLDELALPSPDLGLHRRNTVTGALDDVLPGQIEDSRRQSLPCAHSSASTAPRIAEGSLTDGQRALLQDWQDALERFLLTAIGLSEMCIILTNSKHGWVEACLEMYAPGIRYILSKGNVKVIYGRDVLEKQRWHKRKNAMDFAGEESFVSQDSLMAAKYHAMKKEAKAFYGKYPDQTWKNILSVGDMCYEQDAVQELAMRRRQPAKEKLRIKSMLLAQEASLGELYLQTVFLQALLPMLVSFDGDFSIDLQNTQSPMDEIAEALDIDELSGASFPLKLDGSHPPDKLAVQKALFDVAVILQLD